MKFASLVATVLIAAAAAGAALAGPGHDLSPKHGGVVVEAGDLDFELVARPDALTLHVRDHGKAVAATGGSAKLTLLTGTEKSEVTLAPVGADRLEAKGAFKVGPGTRVVALVTLPGRKPANVRFALK